MVPVSKVNTRNSSKSGGLEILIQTGELYFGVAPTVVSTILHSRTVITFWHPKTCIGGMSHIVKVAAPVGEEDIQYGECAIAEFARLADKYNAARNEFEVRVFDGKVMAGYDARRHEVMLDSLCLMLKQQGFIVTELDGFVDSSRKIRLDMTNGNVRKRDINSAQSGVEKKTEGGKHADECVMEIFLHPGDIYFGRAPTVISTLLGSCVAATLWHPKEKLGGMCHIVLPISPDGKCEMRYGNCAIADFVKQATKYNTLTKDYVVNVYGGSDMFPEMKKTDGMKIGERNVDKVKELLEVYGFCVNEFDTGGSSSRKIRLDLSDGSVGIRKHSKPLEG